MNISYIRITLYTILIRIYSIYLTYAVDVIGILPFFLKNRKIYDL